VLLGDDAHRIGAKVRGVTALPRYPWTRWWLPVGIEPLLTSGFLDDPAGPYAAYRDNQAVRLADCDETSCVVLFGDAGMGKSTELEEDRARHRAGGTPSVLLDLGEDETWTDARNRLLSHSDVVAWQAAADAKLVVLVDSVDEVTTSMRKLTDQLLRPTSLDPQRRTCRGPPQVRWGLSRCRWRSSSARTGVRGVRASAGLIGGADSDSPDRCRGRDYPLCHACRRLRRPLVCSTAPR
jgi:hypothetical protein